MKRAIKATGLGPALLGSLRALLTYRYLPIVIAVLGMTLALSSLNVGWILEDHFQRWTIMGSSKYEEVLPSTFDIWRFFDGGERVERMREIGLLPWWTYSGLRWAFWTVGCFDARFRLSALAWPL